MKKLLCVLLILILSVCTLVSCDGPEIRVDGDGYLIVNGINTGCGVETEEGGDIRYPMNFGTKIESLPEDEQKLIGEYVQDCITGMAAQYSDYYLSGDSRLSDPYIAFTNAFVYDFRGVDEASMSEKSQMTWNYIKKNIGQGRAPIMYVELDGYVVWYPDSSMPVSFKETNRIYGCFIFADDSFEQYNYNMIAQATYSYALVDGTEVINCGDKYAKDFSKWEILTFDFNQKLLRLKIEK